MTAIHQLAVALEERPPAPGRAQSRDARALELALALVQRLAVGLAAQREHDALEPGAGLLHELGAPGGQHLEPEHELCHRDRERDHATERRRDLAWMPDHVARETTHLQLYRRPAASR